MSTADFHSDVEKEIQSLNAEGLFFGIAVSEWNSEITKALLEGALEVLRRTGVKEQNICVKYVPGTFELSLAAQFLAEQTPSDAVICIGCVIQGETKHFDFICNAAANGITNVGLKHNKPTIFGVLTPNTIEQARERAGGKYGNKGAEAAITAIKMVHLQKSFI